MNVFIFLKIYVTFRFVRLARRSRISNAHQKTVDGNLFPSTMKMLNCFHNKVFLGWSTV